jgi:hypothetical protein
MYKTEHYDPVALLSQQSAELFVASWNEDALEKLAGKVKWLYGAVTPYSSRAVSTIFPMLFLTIPFFWKKRTTGSTGHCGLSDLTRW